MVNTKVEVKVKPAVVSPYYNTALSFIGVCNQLTRFALSILHLLLAFLQLTPYNTIIPPDRMGDEVRIDRDTFNNRLYHFVSTWKGDKRQSNDALFGGVGSIVILLGRNEESLSFQKNNAMHVSATSRIPFGIKS